MDQKVYSVLMSKAKRKSDIKVAQNISQPADSFSNTPQKDQTVLDQSLFKDLQNKIQANFAEFNKSKKGDKPKTESLQKSRSKDSKDDGSQRKLENRGKKRDRTGNVIAKPKNFNQVTNADTNVAENTQDIQNEFEEEVRALGGTTEDLDLIADAQSDSEMSGSDTGDSNVDAFKKGGQALKSGISNILKEIALAQGARVETTDESEDAQEEQLPAPQTKAKKVTLPEPVTIDKSKVSSNKQKSKLKCEPRPDWYDVSSPIDSEDHHGKAVPQQIVLQLKDDARKLLDEENEMFKSIQQTSSSQSFYNTVVASGTLSDKISALTLAVQESPIHNVKALETLIGLAKKRSRSQAIDVLRSLKDLFAQGSLLPSNRKLYPFSAQPALIAAFKNVSSWRTGNRLPSGLEEKHLIVWMFEDWLKEQYFEIMKILEVWCNDEIEFSKSKAISFVYELLKEKPEQESNLLRLLINKLGDPVKKIASQTSYLLMQLLGAHPAMKGVVISAIEGEFIFRPGQSLHAKYYAAVTINQTVLSVKEEEVAAKLLDIYFGLFSGILKLAEGRKEEEAEVTETPSKKFRNSKAKAKPVQSQEDELKEKLVSAVLTGVNRAYPFVGEQHQRFTDHLDTLFKVAHSSNFNTSIQAMLLIQQLSLSHQVSNDRFYRVLYESLLDPRLISASKHQLYLNLVHRALKADLNMNRVKAFVKRILQILSLHEPPFICAVFFLLKDLEKTFPALTGLIDQPEDHDDDEEVFRDVDEENTGVANSDANHASTVNASTSAKTYDAHKRAPEHANADNSCVWELLPFLAHYHPSVSVSSDNVINHEKLSGKPDLTLYTLIHFLDRFVYRNPKLSSSGIRGSSIMQPMASGDTHAMLIKSESGAHRTLPVNSEAFKVKKDDEIAAEEVFFHKYFATLGKEPVKKKKKGHKQADGEDDDEAGSGDEDAIWKAMIDSAPDLEGANSDDDDDLEFSDLESDLDDDEEVEDDMNKEMVDDDSEGGVDVEAGIFDDSDDGLMEAGILEDESDFEDFDAQAETSKSKAKTSKKASDRERLKKLKALPTFASVSDYAKMLDDDDDEDMG